MQKEVSGRKHNVFKGEILHEHFMNYHVNFLVIFMTDTLYVQSVLRSNRNPDSTNKPFSVIRIQAESGIGDYGAIICYDIEEGPRNPF